MPVFQVRYLATKNARISILGVVGKWYPPSPCNRFKCAAIKSSGLGGAGRKIVGSRKSPKEGA